MTGAPDPCVTAMPFEWGVAARTLHGQSESGDIHLVATTASHTLIIVVDGLGHGPEAAAAARIAVAISHENLAAPVTTLVERCHVALQRTRGVVMSVADINTQDDTMTWLGVGNVDGTLFRANAAHAPFRESLPHRGGVVGYQLPPLRAGTLLIAPGDTLVFATDGIGSSFTSDSPIGWHPQDAADHILDRFAKDTDDALVLVARYRGGLP